MGGPPTKPALGRFSQHGATDDEVEEAVGENAEFDELDARMRGCWDDILSQSPLIRTVMGGCQDRRLYALYLIETFQYTKHNAQNQALVGVRLTPGHTTYLQFCLRHAAEEAGHEQMALHDLKSIGVDPARVTALVPMPATEVLVAYLYWISIQGNPVQRLGYSYWAENSYHFIGPVLKAIQTQMKLDPKQMTFFVEHATIDTRHADQVKQMIRRGAKTAQDWSDIGRVLEQSLRLTGNILTDVHREYERLRGGGPSAYDFLNTLA